MEGGSSELPGAPAALPPGELPPATAEDFPPAGPPPEPCTREELVELAHSGVAEADLLERGLAQSARAQAALELALAEGLLELEVGDRLIRLGFSRLTDYGEAILHVQPRTTQALVRLARELRTRPLLRAALREGKVRLRNAQAVLPVAVGEAEAAWVERARTETVRSLEKAVRAARRGRDEQEEKWRRLRVRLSPEQRATVDEALAIAGKVLPGSGRAERLEAMAQEYLGEHPTEAGDDGGGPAGASLRWTVRDCVEARKERLECETERWAYLAEVIPVPAPAGGDEQATARAIDLRLRQLAGLRASYDRVVGYAAYAVKKSRLWQVLGFVDPGHYAEERLGLSARAVEQRAAVEERLWQVPALREARDAGLGYEKVRLLGQLPDAEIPEWIPKARKVTSVALRQALEGRRDAQMRAARELRESVPARVGLLLAAAFRAVRAVEGRLLDDGTCLVRMAEHFIETWKAGARKARTPSQKVRERDLGRCQVPGCSRRAVHSHHIVPRSHGGSDDPTNQVAVCACHHLRGIHGGYIRVRGLAPDRLVWEVGGRIWKDGDFGMPRQALETQGEP